MGTAACGVRKFKKIYINSNILCEFFL